MADIVAAILVQVERIPATFWGVLAGSFFTLFGVWMTSFSQDRRTRQERDMQLRQKIYLDAAEAISEEMTYLTRLGNSKMDLEEIQKPYMAKVAALAKVQIIASEPTALALATFQAEHARALMRVHQLRMPLTLRGFHEKQLLDEISRRAAEVDRLKQKLEDESNMARIQGVNQSIQNESVNIEALIAQHQALGIDGVHDEIDLASACRTEVMSLWDLFIPLIAAVRVELQLPYDAEAQLRIGQASRKAIELDYKQFLESMKANVPKAPDPGRPTPPPPPH